MKQIIFIIILSPALLLRYLAEVLQFILSVICWLILKPFCGKKMTHFRNLWLSFKRGLRDII
jgi:hypothetical protein